MNNDFKIHSVKYNFIMNMILRMSSFIFPMITFPYVSRILLASGNGKIAFAASIINYFTLFASLGIPTYGVKICAQVRDDKIKLSRTVQELLTINFICMVISYIIFIIMMFLVPEFSQNSTLLWINSISIVLSVAGIEWFYQAIEQYDYITFRNIFFKVVSIMFMFAFVHNQNDYIIYGAITIIGTVGSNILNIIKLPHYITLKKVGNYCFSKHFKPIIFLFLYSAATTIYTNLDTVMLGFISGDIQVGYYNAAVKLKNILVSIVTALGSVLMPRISYYLGNGNKKEFTRLVQKSFNFTFLVSIPFSVYFVYEATSSIGFLAGSGYEQAVPVMQIIIPSIIFIGIGSVTAWQLLIPLGKDIYTVIAAAIGGIVDLIINILLIPIYGAMGAAIGTLIAEVIVVSIHFLVLHDVLINIRIKKELFKILISICFASAFYFLIIKFIILDNLFLRLLITSILFFSSYFLSLLLLKENIVYEYKNKLLNKLMKQ